MLCVGPHLGVFYYLITLLLTPRPKASPRPLSKRRGEFQKGGETSRSASYGTLFLFVGSNRIYFS